MGWECMPRCGFRTNLTVTLLLGLALACGWAEYARAQAASADSLAAIREQSVDDPAGAIAALKPFAEHADRSVRRAAEALRVECRRRIFLGHVEAGRTREAAAELGRLVPAAGPRIKAPAGFDRWCAAFEAAYGEAQKTGKQEDTAYWEGVAVNSVARFEDGVSAVGRLADAHLARWRELGPANAVGDAVMQLEAYARLSLAAGVRNRFIPKNRDDMTAEQIRAHLDVADQRGFGAAAVALASMYRDRLRSSQVGVDARPTQSLVDARWLTFAQQVAEQGYTPLTLEDVSQWILPQIRVPGWPVWMLKAESSMALARKTFDEKHDYAAVHKLALQSLEARRRGWLERLGQEGLKALEAQDNVSPELKERLALDLRRGTAMEKTDSLRAILEDRNNVPPGGEEALKLGAEAVICLAILALKKDEDSCWSRLHAIVNSPYESVRSTLRSYVLGELQAALDAEDVEKTLKLAAFFYSKVSTGPDDESGLLLRDELIRCSETFGGGCVLAMVASAFPGTPLGEKCNRAAISRCPKLGSMPNYVPLTRINYSSISGHSMVIVSNRTNSPVLAIVHGPITRCVGVPPVASARIVVPDGTYHVVAALEGAGNAGIKPAEAKQKLAGGNYELAIFIETQNALGQVLQQRQSVRVGVARLHYAPAGVKTELRLLEADVGPENLAGLAPEHTLAEALAFVARKPVTFHKWVTAELSRHPTDPRAFRALKDRALGGNRGGSRVDCLPALRYFRKTQDVRSVWAKALHERPVAVQAANLLMRYDDQIPEELAVRIAHNDHEKVRETFLTGMRYDSPAVAKPVAVRLLHEMARRSEWPAPQRAAAVDILVDLGSEEQVCDFLGESLQKDTDPGLLRPLLKTKDRTRNGALVSKLLSAAAGTDTSNWELRAVATAALVHWRHGKAIELAKPILLNRSAASQVVWRNRGKGDPRFDVLRAFRPYRKNRRVQALLKGIPAKAGLASAAELVLAGKPLGGK